MASKVVLVALVLIALVASAAAATGERGHAVPLRRAEHSLGWMNGMKGGPPSGMQQSVTATTAQRRAVISKQLAIILCGSHRHVFSRCT